MTPVSDDSTAQATTTQADINDDLAKALASVQAGGQAPASGQEMNFESVGEPVIAGPPAVGVEDPSVAPVISAPPVAPVMPATPVIASTPAPLGDDQVEYSTPPASIDHTQPTVPSTPFGASTADSIEQIKLSALQQLRPLMQHIELTPEEKFEKYLMMLRASDDQDLIQPTYEAAQMISSEKLKAQALLDVINEINYLTSQQLVA